MLLGLGLMLLTRGLYEPPKFNPSLGSWQDHPSGNPDVDSGPLDGIDTGPLPSEASTTFSTNPVTGANPDPELWTVRNPDESIFSKTKETGGIYGGVKRED